MAKSIEEKVEDFYKRQLHSYQVKHWGKTEAPNDTIRKALDEAESKSGGSGPNFPDIQLMLTDKQRSIPVMVEVKGSKGKLEKLVDGEIVLTSKSGKSTPAQQYAVNGALHYGNAILEEGSYKEVIIVGVNGTTVQPETGDVADPEIKAYYVAKRNSCVPKEIPRFSFVQCKAANIPELFATLDDLSLTEKERERLKRKMEQTLEEKVKHIHQEIYDNPKIGRSLDTNSKLYLFCGLIMAGLPLKTANLAPEDLKGNSATNNNDGTKLLDQITTFLTERKAAEDKIRLIRNLLDSTFMTEILWKPAGGISILHALFKQVKEDIIPLFQEGVNLDFTGLILNSLSDWVSIAENKRNDVVLTPRYVTHMMAVMARTNKDSWVWDNAMGSAGFLVSAMDIMIRDAEDKIQDKEERQQKIENIKHKQLLGIEILPPIYILGVLNMILMGDGSSNMFNGDSLSAEYENKAKQFPANVYLLNPPYSREGKGFIFVEEALKLMDHGYACVLIQENAGSGQGLPYTKRILEHNTLQASIHMPLDLFGGKSSVQAAIYAFQIGRPHDVDDLVTFIDMADDGYTRQNRKKSTQKVNLRDTDHAEDRYAEVEAIVLGKKPKTQYYTEENGKVVRDTITLKGDDWTFADHKPIDTTPTKEDFRKAVAEYLSWKVGTILRRAGE